MFTELTPAQVLEALRANPGKKQPELLAILYPPTSTDPEAPYGREADPTGEHPEGGNPIKPPHQQLERILRSLRGEGRAHFAPRSSFGGWYAS